MQGDTAQIALGFRLLCGRAPTGSEAKRLLDLLQAQRTLFADDAQGAKALLAMGESKRDEGLDTTEHAAMTVVMHAIFNLDTTIWRR